MVLIFRTAAGLFVILALWSFARMLTVSDSMTVEAQAAAVSSRFMQMLGGFFAAMFLWWMGDVCMLLGEISEKLGNRSVSQSPGRDQNLARAKEKLGL